MSPLSDFRIQIEEAQSPQDIKLPVVPTIELTLDPQGKILPYSKFSCLFEDSNRGSRARRGACPGPSGCLITA